MNLAFLTDPNSPAIPIILSVGGALLAAEHYALVTPGAKVFGFIPIAPAVDRYIQIGTGALTGFLAGLSAGNSVLSAIAGLVVGASAGGGLLAARTHAKMAAGK